MILCVIIQCYFDYSHNSFDGLSIVEMSQSSFFDEENNLYLSYDGSGFVLSDKNSGEQMQVKIMRGNGKYLYARFFDEHGSEPLFTGSMFVSDDGNSVKLKFDSWKIEKANFKRT